MKWLKNILVWILAIIGLSVSGALTIDMKEDTEKRQSSYKLTAFDYIISSPSKEQVTKFRASSEEIGSIFPCYAFRATLSGNSSSSVKLLLSDQMEYYNIGLFNDDTKEEGTYSETGMCLDRLAATKLGVNVGDKVSVSLAYKTFEFTVCSIYMTSTYKEMDKGLALAKFSTEISNAYAKELSYDLAFIDAKDTAKCAEKLKNYIPLGNLQSEEEYIAESKANSECPPYMSDDEWTESLKISYENYKSAYMNGTYTGAVQDKSVYMMDIQEQVKTTKTKINYVCIGIAVGIVVLYTLLSIVFVYSNKKNDKIDAKDGKTNIVARHIIMTILGAVIVSAGTALLLTIYGSVSQFLSSFMVIIFSFSLPVLISIPVTIPFITKYGRELKQEISKEKGIYRL